MNKILKLCGCFCGFVIMCVGIGVCGVSGQVPFQGIKKMETESAFFATVNENMSREEKICVTDYIYPDNLGLCDYKYKKLLRTITYYDDKTKAVVAIADMDFVFRYNTKTREAECLSSSKGTVCNDSSYTLNIFSRTVNETTELGAGTSDVKLRHRGEIIDKDAHEITCDYLGNISHCSR